MIKIRVWYDIKMYYHIDYVVYESGRSEVKLLGKNEIYFSPDLNKPLTTMLWTGLKNNMGKDIWEGDIVEFYYKGNNVRCEIVFMEAMFCLKWKDGYVNNYQLNASNYCVVGNIYEMPDWKNY